jgi:hypothetical protein
MTAPILVAGEALYDLVVRDHTTVPELHDVPGDVVNGVRLSVRAQEIKRCPPSS